ncbi:acyl-CoA dehydrogenase family protein [Amycolatopsis rhabdoformis]|uniref:Acyl-CoA dehydrogenase family protein n=1 Tax=Amycolatopsis rhabdoformis TaxID=1448059 RepID=A0ABZ1II16_9PSEU|nr:acyl-CoA dehydrogenase family protein [Amycolatopsis rhabdoformis]WSE33808.1 acyl-CoA dehydrogenase family protein [Amycolatopsis rhabdoformis]
MNDLVARGRELRPLLTAEAARGEADRRLTDKAVRALDDAGLFRLGTPRRFGGHETTLRTLVDVGAEVGAADGATSWVLTLVNACAWVVGLFPPRAQEEVFGADPHAKIAGALAPTAEAERVPGGYRVGGRWPYASGIAHAGWALLGIPVGAAGEPAMALVPESDYAVERTWAVAGMRGTGSDTVVADGLVVPDHRIVRTAEVLQRVPVFAPYLTVVLAAPQLGLGRAALRLVGEAATRKGVTGTGYARQADSAVFQLRFAEAALKIDTGHLHTARAADDVDTAVASGDPMSDRARARVHGDVGLAVQSVVDAIGILVAAHGTGGFADTHPLQRIWRDANFALTHAMAQPAVNYEIYGKALLGVRPNITAML